MLRGLEIVSKIIEAQLSTKHVHEEVSQTTEASKYFRFDPPLSKKLESMLLLLLT